MSASDHNPKSPQFRVSSCADWENVAAATSDFHDAVVREVALLGEEYLDTDYWLKMTYEIGAIVRVLVHIQRRDTPAAELTFSGVQELVWDAAGLVDPARCSTASGGMLMIELASLAVTARECVVTLLGESALGEHARLGEPRQDPD